MIFPPQISRRFSAATLLASACALVLSVSPAPAIIINGEGPDGTTGIYDRFVVGTYPAAPTPNPSFIAAGLDLSGIGWLAGDATRSVTLVSPRFALAATHFLPGIGSTLRFLGTDSILYSATVQAYHTLSYDGSDGVQSSDVTLLRLAAPVAAQVTPMPIVHLGVTDIDTASTFDAYLGLSLLNYGKTARMGTNVLDEFTEFSLGPGPITNIGLVYDSDAGLGETRLEGGDSGSPTLADLGGGVYGLVGIHSGVDTGVSPVINVDAFIAYSPFVDAMSTIVEGYGESLTLVPEPGALGYGLLILGVCGARRLRRVVRRT